MQGIRKEIISTKLHLSLLEKVILPLSDSNAQYLINSSSLRQRESYLTQEKSYVCLNCGLPHNREIIAGVMFEVCYLLK